MSDVEPNRAHNGGFSTDATDPEAVKALARRIIRPLRERAKALGYALAEHGSQARDIDLIAVPWTDKAHPAEHLANSFRQVLEQLYGVGLEVPPGATPRAHGRLCWSFWIKPWTYVDLSVYPTTPDAELAELRERYQVAAAAVRRLTSAVANAYYEGFVECSKHQPWDDMFDWAALKGRQHAIAVLSGSKPPEAPEPTPSSSQKEGEGQ